MKTNVVAIDRNFQAENYGTSTFFETAESLLNRGDFEKAAQNVRAKFQAAEKSVNNMRREGACLAYRLALQLKDRVLWNRFQRDKFWAGHSRLDHKHLLRYSAMYLYGASRGPIANVARDHARALAPLWTKGWDAEQVFAALERGGFAGLKKKHADERGDNIKPAASAKVAVQLKVRAQRKLRGMKDGAEGIAILRVDKRNGRPVIILIRIVEDGNRIPTKLALRLKSIAALGRPT